MFCSSLTVDWKIRIDQPGMQINFCRWNIYKNIWKWFQTHEDGFCSASSPHTQFFDEFNTHFIQINFNASSVHFWIFSLFLDFTWFRFYQSNRISNIALTVIMHACWRCLATPTTTILHSLSHPFVECAKSSNHHHHCECMQKVDVFTYCCITMTFSFSLSFFHFLP